MYNQNYKVELPQFPDREVSIAEYGARSGDLRSRPADTMRRPLTARSAKCRSRGRYGKSSRRHLGGGSAPAVKRCQSSSGQSGYVKIHQVQRGLSAADHQL